MFSRALDKDEKTNYWNDSTVQCSSTAADEWKKEMINVDEKSAKNVKINEIVKKDSRRKKEFWYNNVRNRRREEFECRNFHKILHWWYDDDFWQLHKKNFQIWKFFKERERGADARERIKEKKEFKEKQEQEFRKAKKKEINEWVSFLCLTFK